jgi:Domain of unknown function (DUF1707)
MVAFGEPMTHNLQVTGDQDGSTSPLVGSNGNARSARNPQPIPEVVAFDGLFEALTEEAGPKVDLHASADEDSAEGEPAVVSDEDRQRYGILLDRAAERGLLGTPDYEVRLGELAAASSIDQMRQIITDLPVFNAPPVASSSRRRRSSPVGTGMLGPSTMADPVKKRASSWVLLVVVVCALAVSLVLLALYAKHLTYRQNGGVPAQTTRPVNALHL